jgi:hypothetical protein
MGTPFGVYLVKTLLLLTGQGISEVNLQILRQHIISLANPTLFGFSKTPAASLSTLIIGHLFSTLDLLY